MNASKGNASADLTSQKLSFVLMDFHECSSKKGMANNWVKIPDKDGGIVKIFRSKFKTYRYGIGNIMMWYCVC
jgi:hypothetical protein